MLRRGLIVKALAVIAVPTVIQAIAFVALASQTRMVQAEANQAKYYMELNDAVSSSLRDLVKMASDADWGGQAYFISEEFADVRRDLKDSLKRLRELLHDTPEEKPLSRLIVAADRLQAELADLIEKVQYGQATDKEFPRAMDSARAFMKLLVIDSQHINELSQQQKDKSLAEEKALRERTQQSLLFFIFAECSLTLFVVVWLKRDVNRRLQVLLENSNRLAINRPLLEKVTGSDEISELDGIFHEMADALRQSVNKERAITQNARDVILSLDVQGIITTMNNASLSVFGFEPDELIGLRLVDQILSDDQERFKSAVKVLNDQEFEARLLTKSGRVLDVLWSLSWSEKERLFFCIAHDVTERKNAERLRQEVLQMVSHDLKTPLFTMTAFLEMLQKGMFGEISDKGQKLLANSCESGDYMQTLIRDLLDIERLESSSVALDLQECSPAEVLTAAATAVSAMATHAGVTLQVQSVQSMMIADSDRILQIILNLTANAIKFSPPSTTVTLSATASNGKVEFSVADQGRGIRQSDLPFIFDRFRQTEKSDRQKGGSGLGLAICKKLVELHGGEIGVRSQEGKGSVFRFTIPAKAEVHTR